MAKGFVSGVIWGTVLSVGGLGAVSVIDTQRSESVVETAASEDMPDGVETPEDVAAAAPKTSEVEIQTSEMASEAGPDAETPDPDPDPDIVADATAPDVDAVETIEAPVAPETTGGDVPVPSVYTNVVTDSDTPDLSTPEQGTDTALDDTTDDPAPEPAAEDTVAALTEPETPQTPAPITTTDSTSDTTQTATAPTLDAPAPEADVTVSTEPAEPPETELSEAPAAIPATESDATDDTTTEAETDAPNRPIVRQLVPDATPDEDKSEATDTEAETAAVDRPAIGRPASSLIDRNGSGSRLPSIGAAPEAETETEDVEANPAASPADLRPALERFAAEAPNVDPTRPRMSIILIDDGTGPLGPETLDNFPFPVTFALDPATSDAAERMSAYRAQGVEVATLANLPDGAQPTDVEQILGGVIAAVPESVALVEAPDSGLQSERATTEQASSFVAESGHGIVFLPNGLNTAEAIARRENVAAINVLRDFDGDGQDARTKRRFLDGAAFRARQDGEVVMLGRLTADTVSALLLWSLQDRASSVSIVPVSVILKDTLD